MSVRFAEKFKNDNNMFNKKTICFNLKNYVKFT